MRPDIESRLQLPLCLGGAIALTGCAPEQNLRGKVVVVTGASSGFGKGVALKLADEGAQVVLAARREDLNLQIARDCQAKGVMATAVRTDVSREEDMANLAKAAMDKFGRIDVWINNAGVGDAAARAADSTGQIRGSRRDVTYAPIVVLGVSRSARATPDGTHAADFTPGIRISTRPFRFVRDRVTS